MKKRIPTLLLSGVLSLSLLSTSAFALKLEEVSSETVQETTRVIVNGEVMTSITLVDGALSSEDKTYIESLLGPDKTVQLDSPNGLVTIENGEEPPAPETYTVTFNSGGGTGTMDSVEVPKKEEGDTTYKLPANGFTAPTGKEFAGWQVGDEVKQVGDEIVLTGDITVTATWKDTTTPTGVYTITLDANGGTVSPTELKTSEGKLTATLPTPTRSGYTFNGWFTEKSGGDEVTKDTVFTSDKTIYAHWTQNSTTDTGNQGGSSGSSSNGTSGSSSPAIKPLPDRNQGTTTPANPSDNPGTTPTFFNDVPANYWAAGAIEWVSENGFMNGINETTFNPEGNITRQQMWMIMSRMAGSSAADMAAARTWAMGRNLTDGTNPAGSMTRQQLVTYLYRFAQRQGFTLSGSSPLTTFPDNALVANYAQTPLSWAVANGIIAGKNDGRLDPTGTATRAQFATILQRFYTNIVNKNA